MDLYREVETKENLKEKIRQEAEELFDGEKEKAIIDYYEECGGDYE